MSVLLEWPEHLDVAALERDGWRPTPFRQFVLKLHGLCNLSCDYCYVYELADASWRTRPATMSAATVEAACARIAEHVRAHALPSVAVVLHGGEPLMAGLERCALVATSLRAALPAATRLDLSVQTNGVLLTEAVLDVLAAHGFRVGLSLDGDRVGHDRHRRHADGRGSHAEVTRALARLADRPGLLGGLLCAVDLASDPITTYEALLEHAPPIMDFLLPHGTWSAPPPGRPPDDSTPYADWLIPVFDRWYDDGPGAEVRLFAEIVHLWLGGASRTEAVGLSPTGVLVVDTDGAVEQVDTLKAAYDGAPATGLNVRDHPFDAALRHPAIAARQIGRGALSPTCLECPVRDVCGGGYYPHRYRAGKGFRNQSVYCADLSRLIDHIGSRLRADLRSRSGKP